MNKYRCGVVAVFLLTALVPATVEARGWEIKSPGLGGLRVVDGRPVFLTGNDRPQDQVWQISPNGKTTITFSGGKQSGRLMYPLKGDDPSVTLNTERKNVEVPKWEVIHVPIKGFDHDTYTIRAAEGKYKGWYLGVELKRSKEDEKKGVYRPILVKNPKEPMIFEIYEIAN